MSSTAEVREVGTAPAISLYQQTGDVANHPTATVTVGPGCKILGGGAAVAAGTGNGNLLTASYPADSFSWTVAAKDQRVADPRSVTAYVYAFSDPDDLYDVQVFTAVSGVDPVPHPAATVMLPKGYILVGGGAQAHYGGPGQFLTASQPTDDFRGWTATSVDHTQSDPGTVTAYAVGLRARAGTPEPKSQANTDTTDEPSQNPSSDAPPPPSFALCGGGAAVYDVSGPGVLLTTCGPDAGSAGEWLAKAHDHGEVSRANLKVWALGINWSS